MQTLSLHAEALSSPEGEAVFGYRQTGSHACYMVYGILRPHERERLVKPGKGHEEMLLALKGDLIVTGHLSGELKQGQAFHLSGDQECFLENGTEAEAVYVIAGGHSEAGHH